MNKILTSLISAALISTAVAAGTPDQGQGANTNTMPPPMRDAMRQQWIQQKQQPPMPMMGNTDAGAMNPGMMQHMMTMHQQNPAGQKGSHMMDPQQMHNMMQVHSDQLRGVGVTLGRIEKLLTELVELNRKP